MNQEIQRIRIPYKPFPKQAAFHRNCEQGDISWLITGTGFGKTFCLLNEVIRRTVTEGSNWQDVLPYLAIVVAPTYKLLKLVHWPILRHYIPDEIIQNIDKVDFKITILGSAEIVCLSGEDPDRLRAHRPNIIALDETRLMDKYIFELGLNRVSYRHGKVFGATTTFGFDWSYDIENMAVKDPEKVRVVKGISADNPFFDPRVIEGAKDRMDEKLWRQEYFASRESYGGNVYYNFSREIHAAKKCEYNPNLPTYFCLDFNVNPMSCIVVQPHGRELWAVDEIILWTASTWNVCEEIFNRYGSNMRENRNYAFYPDPSGIAKQHGGYSSFQIIRQYFKEKLDHDVVIKHRGRAPYVQDRVNAVNSVLKNVRGESRFYIDPVKCPYTIKSFEQTQYVEGSSVVDKTKGAEHMTDAVGYMIEIEYPMAESTIGVAA